MIAEMGGATIVPVLGMFGLHTLCIFCMLAVYGLMIFLLARLNPFRFYKKNRGAMLTSFSLMSSSAAMPTNMKTCTEQFGISPKICSFSIPLGATVNMDGTCISLTVSSLFLARAYGIELTGGMLLSLAVTNILLSLGAPGVPGVGLICLSVALNSIGVPIEAIALVMGIYPIINMLNTMSIPRAMKRYLWSSGRWRTWWIRRSMIHKNPAYFDSIYYRQCAFFHVYYKK